MSPAQTDSEEINKNLSSNVYYSINHDLHRPINTHDPKTNSKGILSGSTSKDVLTQGQVLLSKFIISCELWKNFILQYKSHYVSVNHICIVHKMIAGNIIRMRSIRSLGYRKGLLDQGQAFETVDDFSRLQSIWLEYLKLLLLHDCKIVTKELNLFI